MFFSLIHPQLTTPSLTDVLKGSLGCPCIIVKLRGFNIVKYFKNNAEYSVLFSKQASTQSYLLSYFTVLFPPPLNHPQPQLQKTTY